MMVDISTFELVSVDGEAALLIRLGRRATDPVSTLDRVTRSFRVREAAPDLLGEFLSETTKDVTGARCRARPLYDKYAAWCAMRGAERASLVGFHRGMKARGFRQVVSNGHWWIGLTVIDDAPAGSLL
jgi:hypothetical protein